jgi:hypothetical protein
VSPLEALEREAPAPRGFPPPRKKGGFLARLLSALTSDLPLKGLALVLAVMAWLVVREKILADETMQDVPVDIIVPESVVVVAPQDTPVVNLRLRGTWNRVARAKRALAEGRRVELRLPELEHAARNDKKGEKGPISDAAAFTFPFDNPEIVSVTRPITVRWNKVEEKPVPLEKPVVNGAAGLEATVSLDDTSVRLRGPASLFEQGLPSITPDKVDASAWLKGNPELSTPWPWESRFDEWRLLDWTRRNPRVLRIEPAVARGKVRFRAIAGQVLEGTLHLDVGDPAWFLTHDYEIERSPEYDPATKKLKLTVLGEDPALDRLRKTPGDWYFYVKVPPPPAAETENGEHQQLPVYLHLPPGVHATLDKAPSLFVTVRRKK